MKTLAQLAVTAALALLVHVAPSNAHEAITASHYCLDYNEGGTDCGFTSLAQCIATASGIGAECSVDFADDGRRMPHTFR